MKVQVDRELCVGHGRCYALAPEVFGEDERGHCLIGREEVPRGFEGQARAAAQNCPEQAIALEDDR